jgi:Cytochrome c7 and related cytochrome c
VPGFICIAALATMLSAYSGASSSEGNSPVQPVAFRHTIHVDTLKMNCLYCHFSANKSFDPGLPAVGTCMGCHTVVATGKPEIHKLAAYWNKKEAVPWVRIHKLPEYVHFPHMRHVNAGVTCQTCHGQIQNMKQPVFQQNSLSMGWCVNCHVNGYKPAEGARLAGAPDSVIRAAESQPVRKARYDCAVCHY